MKLPPVPAFVICVLIWGTTWIAIRIGYEGLDPLWGAALRFLLAGAIVTALAVFRGLPPPLGRRQVGVILAVGILLFGLDYGLIYWGEQWLPSGLTAILFATLPLFTVLAGARILPTEHVSWQHLLGILVSFGGLLAIFYDDLSASDGGAFWPAMAIVASAAACAVANVVVRRWGRDIPPLVLNAGGMFVGSVGLMIASAALGERFLLPATRNAWLSLLYLVLFGSVVSFVLYWDLLKRWAAHRATLLALLTPVVALVTGVIVGETLSGLQWIGSLIVLAGIAVSLQPALAPTPPPSPVPAAK